MQKFINIFLINETEYVRIKIDLFLYIIFKDKEWLCFVYITMKNGTPIAIEKFPQMKRDLKDIENTESTIIK